ncbi:hypothetical protein C8R48DRAFT_706644 [Suillus tomentosus]|nr:hypothetical protein C8R48DRAFT_706644 [Suillus tomentosus]
MVRRLCRTCILVARQVLPAQLNDSVFGLQDHGSIVGVPSGDVSNEVRLLGNVDLGVYGDDTVIDEHGSRV